LATKLNHVIKKGCYVPSTAIPPSASWILSGVRSWQGQTPPGNSGWCLGAMFLCVQLADCCYWLWDAIFIGSLRDIPFVGHSGPRLHQNSSETPGYRYNPSTPHIIGTGSAVCTDSLHHTCSVLPGFLGFCVQHPRGRGTSTMKDRCFPVLSLDCAW
jgi:hypothetical protein